MPRQTARPIIPNPLIVAFSEIPMGDTTYPATLSVADLSAGGIEGARVIDLFISDPSNHDQKRRKRAVKLKGLHEDLQAFAHEWWRGLRQEAS